MMLLAISLALSAMLNCAEKMGTNIVTDCEDILVPQTAFLKIDGKYSFWFTSLVRCTYNN